MASLALASAACWYVDRSVSTGSRSNYASRNKSIVRGLAYHRRVYRCLEAWRGVNASEQQLEIEPWLRDARTKRLLQPDACIIDPATNTGLVIEVKLNWKDGRDEKLLNEYLAAAESAFELDCVWPALITSNVAGLAHKPRLGLGQLLGCCDWHPGHPTPVLLLP